MSTNEKQKKFFNFLQKKETAHSTFTLAQVLSATGWQKSTFKSYQAKGQLSEFVSIADSGDFEASNTLNLKFKQFEKKLSQSKHVQALGHKSKSKLAKALLRKSKDNMLLALELYNRPSLENKIDGFVMLFCAAWEQLLKAMIIENKGEKTIFRKTGKKGIKETISLRECLDLVFVTSDNIKENILKITDLRDKAIHLLMPEIQAVASRLFQSGVFNYSSKFEEFSEVPFINTSNTGMISLVGEFSTPPLSMLKSVYGNAADDIIKLAENLTKSIEDSNDIAYAIPLNVTLHFAKKGEEGTQIVLTKAEDGMAGLKDALVIEKSVDAERTHPYKQGTAIDEISKRLKDKYDENFLKEHLPSRKNDISYFNPNCFQSMIHKLSWKNSNNKYHHFLSTANTHLYSEAAITTIIDKIVKNTNYLLEAKKSYSNRNKT